jgi:fatty acid desaturase
MRTNLGLPDVGSTWFPFPEVAGNILTDLLLERNGSQKLDFRFTEFSEVGRAALVTFSTSWRLIHQLSLVWRVTKQQSNGSRRKGNTLGWVVWVLLSVMLVCLLLWAATGAVALLFAAVLATLVMIYVVLFTNL